MYIPKLFEMEDTDGLLEFIDQWNFGDLVTTCNGELFVNHIPFIVDAEQHKLYGHLAIRNPQCAMLEQAEDMLVVFRGAHSYVSPTWYVSEQMVPTWNFESVQVRGNVKLVSGDGLLNILIQLSERHENQFVNPWKIDKLSQQKLDAMMKAIVGFEINISSIKGKSKLSQNRNKKDKAGVIAGLRLQNDSMSSIIADKMESSL